MPLHVPALLAAQSASVVHSTHDHTPLICTQPGYGPVHAAHSLLTVDLAHAWLARSHLEPTVLLAQWVSLVHSTHEPLASLIGVGAWHAPLVMQVCELESHLPPLHWASVRQSTHAPPKHLSVHWAHASATLQLAP